MNIFKKKCEYCRKKIDKGKEIFRNVKTPEFLGTIKKSFCSKEHADNYEEESKNAKKCASGCCG